MVIGRPYQGVGGSPEEASWEWMSNSHTPWAKNVRRRKRLKCYVQGSGRRKKKKGIDSGSGRRDYALFGASVFSPLNPSPGSFSHRRIWDPKIKSAFPDITLRARARTRYNGANLYLLLLYILKELAHDKATRSKASLTTTSTTHHVESYSGASHSRPVQFHTPMMKSKLWFKSKLRRIKLIQEGEVDSVLSTQEYMKKVVEDVSDDEDFKSGSWVSATNYVNANGGIVLYPLS
ncbi:hypothetical protein Tco_0911922 [Tanacetum coccineum]